jgi:DNA-binding Lrp family transcriptional regulator
MANNLKISTQAVGKIRKGLEEKGLIEGYSCNLNFEKLGLNHFALTLLKIKNKFWKTHGEVNSIESVKKYSSTLFSCMPSSSDTSLIELRAFRNAKEMDRFFHLLNVRQNDYFETIKTLHFSNLNFLNYNPKELLNLILDDKPIVPEK